MTNRRTRKAGSSPLKKTVVIIGDWFIDENWLVAKHESYSSSHIGDIQYLSKHPSVEKRMISLCGAPELLVVLNSFLGDKYEFIGFGAWNQIDNDIVKCTSCTEIKSGKFMTPYTIKSLQNVSNIPKEGSINNEGPKDYERTCPYDSSKCSYPELESVNLAAHSRLSTNRIIRCYEGYSGGLPHLRYRFDWQLPIGEKDLNFDDLKNKLKGKSIAAVIIEDHGKGVVNDISMTKLLKVLRPSKNRRWYIRSKIDNPVWLKILKDNDIKARLHVIDYKLAKRWSGERRRLVGTELSRASLEMIGKLTGSSTYVHGSQREPESYYQSDRAAILFEDNTVLAKDFDDCFNLDRPPGPEQLINVGRTTMFFNALIAQDLSARDQTSKLGNFGLECYNALQVSFKWSKQASRAWSKTEPHFYGDYTRALDCLREPQIEPEIQQYNYDKLWQHWNKSSKNLGVLEIGDTSRFQMWRGKGTLEGYICVGGPKRSKINELLRKVGDFNNQDSPKHPLNCLLYVAS
jgi:hypothetical protein